MNIIWNISQADIIKVNKVVKDNDNAFLRERQFRNIEKNNILLDKNIIIKTMIMCLLTSQQRSGPNSTVGKFLQLEPFPITQEKLTMKSNVKHFVMETLVNNDLNRFVNRISSFFSFNYQLILDNNWKIIEDLDELRNFDSKTQERDFADKLADEFKGFGPKQSRNFLQALGLTKYEIPIDSRITSWLNNIGFPLSLASQPLGDLSYYHFVLDGIQELSEKAGVYPCILDAAIFSSFDKDKWTNENIIF